MLDLDTSAIALRINIEAGKENDFSGWQSNLRSQISHAQGFLSVEILCPTPDKKTFWVINQSFVSKKDLQRWMNSQQYQSLLKDLVEQNMVVGAEAIFQEPVEDSQGGATEIYITFVDQEKLAAFSAWHAKIHEQESRFPGFQKVYVQAPNNAKKEGAWITLLQFDSNEHLENWLNSPIRAKILRESEEFVTSLETHRLLSSFGGWFIDRDLAKVPPRWKQNMLILSVLFPIVMMEFTFLSPHLKALDPSPRTFLENIISVTLMGWPFLPLAIYCLKWWLETRSVLVNCLGILLLSLLYLLEIFLFWS